jgi:hypothetical protein
MNKRIGRREILAACGGMLLPIGSNLAHALSDMSRIKNIVFVHGRDQQGKAPEQLRAAWVKSLRGACERAGGSWPEDIDIRFPYYGDELASLVAEADLPLPSEVASRGTQDDGLLEFQASVFDDLRRSAGVSDSQVQAQYGREPSPRGPLNHRWVLALLRSLDKNRPGLGAETLESFTRDVYLYLTIPKVQRVVDGIVSRDISNSNSLVIAHSLGTVVTYNVLRAKPDARVDKMITIGSPLGVRSIASRLAPLSSLSSVGSWFNGFDQLDVVALNPLDTAHFSIGQVILNDGTLKNGSDNHHDATGYLACPQIGKAVVAT